METETNQNQESNTNLNAPQNPNPEEKESNEEIPELEIVNISDIGITLVGKDTKCENEKNENKKCMRSKGDECNVIKDMEEKCQYCHKKFKVTTLIVLHCKYKISGIDNLGNEFNEEGEVNNMNWKQFNISECKCECDCYIYYADVNLKDFRFPDQEKITIQSDWTCREFIDCYQNEIKDFTPLMLMINGKTILLNEKLSEHCKLAKADEDDFSCLPIGYVDED